MTLDVLYTNLPRLIAMAVLIAVSGMISASETALFALTRHQLTRLRQSNRRSAQRVLRLRDDPRALLSAVLLANIAVNILLYSMLAVTVTRLAGGSPVWTGVLGVVGFLVVLVCAEIAPKLLALAARERLALLVAEPIRIIQIATAPIRWLLETVLVESLTRLLGGTAQPQPPLRREELQEFVDLGRAEGTIDDDENTLLNRVMGLAATRVSALMVPRVDVVAFNLDDDRNEIVRLIRRHRLLRIPAYETDIDNIKGVISSKELLLHPDRSPRSLIRPCHFVPEQAGVEDLLQHFRATRSQLAFAVDEYGGLAGVVALEDIAEAVVGELSSPDEPGAGPPVRQVDDRVFLIDGGLDISDFGDAFGLEPEDRRVQTVGGLVAEELDRLPAVGDSLRLGDLQLTVLAMKGRRVARIELRHDRAVQISPGLDRLTGRHGSASSNDVTPPEDLP